jgi:hypothetical protein
VASLQISPTHPHNPALPHPSALRNGTEGGNKINQTGVLFQKHYDTDRYHIARHDTHRASASATDYYNYLHTKHNNEFIPSLMGDWAPSSFSYVLRSLRFVAARRRLRPVPMTPLPLPHRGVCGCKIKVPQSSALRLIFPILGERLSSTFHRACPLTLHAMAPRLMAPSLT